MAEPMVQVRFDEAKLRQIEQAVRHIPGAMQRIIPPSLNRTATWTRTRMARAVAQQTGAKVGESRRVIHLARASRANWHAQVLIMNARMPVARFATAQEAAGVAYQLPGGAAGRIRHGFFATMPSGHRGVFLRSRYARRGKPIRRERRVHPRTGRVYSTELPIYEQHLFLHRVLRLAFLPPLARAAGAQLAREIASRVRWQLGRRR